VLVPLGLLLMRNNPEKYGLLPDGMGYIVPVGERMLNDNDND